MLGGLSGLWYVWVADRVVRVTSRAATKRSRWPSGGSGLARNDRNWYQLCQRVLGIRTCYRHLWEGNYVYANSLRSLTTCLLTLLLHPHTSRVMQHSRDLNHDSASSEQGTSTTGCSTMDESIQLQPTRCRSKTLFQLALNVLASFPSQQI